MSILKLKPVYVASEWQYTAESREVSLPLGIGIERREGGLGPHWILSFDIFISNFYQKGCFLSFEWEKGNFTIFGSPGEIIGYPRKTTGGSFLKKSFGRPWPQGSIHE